MDIHEFDKIETLPCGSVIQSGSVNNRVYLMNLAPGAVNIAATLIDKARKHGYTKVFAKIPTSRMEEFIQEGYEVEATTTRFYRGEEDAVFMAYFLRDVRAWEKDAREYERVLQLALDKAKASAYVPDPNALLQFRLCDESDAGAMADIFRRVFTSYPFPVDDPDYLRETMRGKVKYFGIESEGRLCALSSAEHDDFSLNSEMSDFATLPEFRGKSLAYQLLDIMEDAMKKEGILCAYTIARAISPGMNITFARHGYRWDGRLKNSTNISGAAESMNVWSKMLN